MFVKATNGQVDKYPYTVGDLRRDNPNTSFPKKIPEATMAEYGMYPVSHEDTPTYDSMTHRIEHSSLPVLKDGKWVLAKTAVALTEEQLADLKARLTKEAEDKRAKAYKEESDPIFFKWQRGSSTQEEWLDAVAAIKQRFPDPE